MRWPLKWRRIEIRPLSGAGLPSDFVRYEVAGPFEVFTLFWFRVNGIFVGIIGRDRESSILLRERVVAHGFWGTKSRIQVTVGWVFWIFMVTLWSEPVSELYAVPVHVCTKKWIGIQLSGSQDAFCLTRYSHILLS